MFRRTKAMKKNTYLKLIAILFAFGFSGQVWSAAAVDNEVCVNDSDAVQECDQPTATITTNNQSINTGTGDVITTDIDASTGTITTLDGGSADFSGTIEGNLIQANDGASDNVNIFATGSNSGGQIDIYEDTGTTSTVSLFGDVSDGGQVLLRGQDGDTAVALDSSSASGGLVRIYDAAGTTTLNIAGSTAVISNPDATVNSGAVGIESLDIVGDLITNDASQLDTADGVARLSLNGTLTSLTQGNGTDDHGIYISDTETLITGGTTTGTLTLNDDGFVLNDPDITNGNLSSLTDSDGITINGGTTTVTVDDGAVDVGGAQITGLADGVLATDAATVGQLGAGVATLNNRIDNLEDDAFSGIAAVAAMAHIPQVPQGHNFAIGLGYGHYEGEDAVALGASARVHENVILKASAGFSGSNTTYGIGGGVSW